MSLTVVALAQRLGFGVQASLGPSIPYRLLCRPVARLTSTCVTLRCPRSQAGSSGTDERLLALKSSEKRIAIYALGSLLVGFVALKVAYSDLVSKKEHFRQPQQSDSGTGMGYRRPLVLAGPSGSGKSTLLKLLFQEYPETFGFTVSHTTRSPRSGEKDGREYHFTSREDMKKSVEAGNFIEWAEFSGNMYGTSKQAVVDVQSSGKVCVLDIDIQGVRSMKKTGLDPLYVFIKPPSVEELEKRLRSRKTESEESLQRRLQRAKTEMKDAEVPGVFSHIIVNDDLEKAYQLLRETLTKEMGLPEKTSAPPES